MSSSPSARILCVDDNKDSCDLIDFMLREDDESYRLTFVRTAEEALDLLDKQAFDLYILDYKLPGMSGIDLCSRIRRRDSETPIMFFSAMAYQHQREAATAAGATEYLVKPNDLDRFPQAVRKRLEEGSNADDRKISIKTSGRDGLS